jgi:hypothetical protein
VKILYHYPLAKSHLFTFLGNQKDYTELEEWCQANLGFHIFRLIEPSSPNACVIVTEEHDATLIKLTWSE